jgi:hypothetical protein
MQEDSDNAVLGGMAIGLLRVLSLLPLRVLHGIGWLGGRIMLAVKYRVVPPRAPQPRQGLP